MGSGPPDPQSGSGLPPYLEILKSVMERSEASDKGTLTFTVDEMIALVNDPDFNLIYPQSAAQFRDILAKYAAETTENSS